MRFQIRALRITQLLRGRNVGANVAQALIEKNFEPIHDGMEVSGAAMVDHHTEVFGAAVGELVATGVVGSGP